MPIHISHNLSIALWFVAYVGLIFLFAVFYFRLYREDPARFAFAADVRNAQRESFQKRTNDQVFVLTQEIEVFRYLSEKLSRKQTPVDLANEKIDVRISDDASFRLFMAGTSQSKSDDQRYPTVAIIDGGVASNPLLEKWKAGDAGLVPAADRDENHATFIAGLVSGGSALNPSLSLSLEPVGCKFYDLDLFPRRELRGSYYPDIEDLFDTLDEKIKVAKRTTAFVFLTLASRSVSALRDSPIPWLPID